jgi:hypothetical protein
MVQRKCAAHLNLVEFLGLTQLNKEQAKKKSINTDHQAKEAQTKKRIKDSQCHFGFYHPADVV